MDKGLINIIDANGDYVCLNLHYVIQMLIDYDVRILGITFDNIADLKTQYELRNGQYPMTTASIEEAFRMNEERSQFG